MAAADIFRLRQTDLISSSDKASQTDFERTHSALFRELLGHKYVTRRMANISLRAAGERVELSLEQMHNSHNPLFPPAFRTIITAFRPPSHRASAPTCSHQSSRLKIHPSGDQRRPDSTQLLPFKNTKNWNITRFTLSEMTITWWKIREEQSITSQDISRPFNKTMGWRFFTLKMHHSLCRSCAEAAPQMSTSQ